MPFICSNSSPPQFPISLRIIFDVPTMPARPSPWPNPAPMTSSPTSFPFDLDLDTWTTFLFPGCFLQDITLLVPSARISVYLEVHVVYTSLQRGLPLSSIKNWTLPPHPALAHWFHSYYVPKRKCVYAQQNSHTTVFIASLSVGEWIHCSIFI